LLRGVSDDAALATEHRAESARHVAAEQLAAR
jgi:hypothetical protein